MPLALRREPPPDAFDRFIRFGGAFHGATLGARAWRQAVDPPDPDLYAVRMPSSSEIRPDPSEQSPPNIPRG